MGDGACFGLAITLNNYLGYNKVMLFIGLMQWWYGDGWRARVAHVRERLASTLDYFSIGLLLKTLFSPFRQISAGKVQGPVGLQVRAFFDKLISRCVGAVVRSVVMLVGILAIVAQGFIGFVGIITWALVPLMPVVGLILFSIGWTPSWQ